MVSDAHIPNIPDLIDGIPSPAANPNLFGHDAALETVKNQLASGRMHHAWLLTAPRGIGKATFAFHFAAHLLSSQSPDGEDINSVRSRVAAGGHPNLIHLTRPWDPKASTFKTQITVEEAGRAIHFLTTSRASDTWRVIIIDAADEMNRTVQNALLKTIEEPPDNTLFLLVNHSISALTPTIRSRCQRLSLKPLSPEDLFSALEPHGVLENVSAEDRALLVKASAGSVRKAILLAQTGGLSMVREFDGLYAAQSGEVDWPAVISLAGKISQRGKEDQYRLLLEIADEFLIKQATGADHDAAPARLARWAELWEETRDAARTAESYNLDRKQVILNLFQSISEMGATAR